MSQQTSVPSDAPKLTPEEKARLRAEQEQARRHAARLNGCGVKIGTMTPMEQLRREHRRDFQKAVNAAVAAFRARHPKMSLDLQAIQIQVRAKFPSLKAWARERDALGIITEAHETADLPRTTPNKKTGRRFSATTKAGQRWRDTAARKNKGQKPQQPKKSKKVGEE